MFADLSVMRPLTRRALIRAASSSVALLAAGGLPLFAQDSTPAAEPVAFSFDALTEEMRALSGKPYESASRLEGFLAELDYDDYRRIRFRPDHARWQGEDARFLVHAFHMGWLFAEPVLIYELSDGLARPMAFSTDDFEYDAEMKVKVPEHLELPGLAGFRLHAPLNRPDVMDELVAFLGASYFRALGRGSAYGLSARGLALNTATAVSEEFPRFSRFYLERPAPGATDCTVYATLEGPSVTGAYRFVIRPGQDTTMEVTARLFFRADVTEMGIAPLTSMFLFADKNRAGFDDYRPNVHDSNGLRIVRADGDVLWRPLNNPPSLAGSYFAETAPRAFGLYQRDRDFENFQDTQAHYERRPSVDVEPIGDWGKGAVRLVEIPTELEVNDNIVAFWVPEGTVRAGDSREIAYRLRWGDLPPDPADERAYVFETRSGIGGVSGVENASGRKFVIDFAGGMLARLPAEAAVEPIVTVANGEIATTVLERLPVGDRWRLILDVTAPAGAIVELSAHIAGYGRKLTETWLHQWINA